MKCEEKILSGLGPDRKKRKMTGKGARPTNATDVAKNTKKGNR